jgi:hypothetical protein
MHEGLDDGAVIEVTRTAEDCNYGGGKGSWVSTVRHKTQQCHDRNLVALFMLPPQ